MNWKEHAHLFANGKFKIYTSEGDTGTFDGIYLMEEIQTNNPEIGYDFTDISNCTLIARKIEDMTDEERGIYNDKRIANVMGGSTESPNSFLYALSIGCLPECFEWDKTVIDIKTL